MANGSYNRLTIQPGLWFSLVIRILRKSPSKRNLIRTVSQKRSATSFLTRALTCSSRLIRTESLMRMRRQASIRDIDESHSQTPLRASTSQQQEQEKHSNDGSVSPISSRSPLNDCKLFRSPSFCGIVGGAIDKIREAASSNPASRCARQLWRRVQIATGINLRTAEDIVAVVEKLKQDEQSSAMAPTSQKQLEDLFLRYLRLGAPDSGVALSFLNAMDPAI